MWITLFLATLSWFSTIQPADTINCENVTTMCHSEKSWTSCYEKNIVNCTSKSRSLRFFRQKMNSSESAEVRVGFDHHVRISSSALQMSIGTVTEQEVMVVASMVDSMHLKLAPPHTPRQGRTSLIHSHPARVDGFVLEGSVLAVKAGNQSVNNLTNCVKLTFKYSNKMENGTCVFWHESDPNNGKGYWSSDGCDTSDSGTEFVCSCNHLSFFAVLVNPVLKVDESNSIILSYITYIGSALSVVLTIITLIVYICLQRRRPEKAIGVHMQLTAALLCLHLGFLMSSFWWLLKEEEDWVCWALGLFLHWSLLASISWMALEGFHLYLLLVRVFNIYVRRYLLKLSLVGWGFPTLVATICGVLGVYGKSSLEVNYNNTHTTTCWIHKERLTVSYVTAAFPLLVVVCNSYMLGLVVFKLWGLRRDHGGSSNWKQIKEKQTRLWKDCATLVGLSCVLGIPWGLAATTYISIPGIYTFTILNSLQGLFVFLWSMALTCKPRDDNNSSVRDPSTQKMMTTSFNN